MASERELDLIRAAAKGDLERDENGGDLTLIRWMLSLTPAERLDALQDFVNDVL